jgi:hypothetical protein
MSEQAKEFWIVKGEYRGEGGSRNPFYSTVLTPEEFDSGDYAEFQKNRFTRVIEHSAYEQIQQENAKLKEQLKIAVDALKSIAANEAVGDVDLEGHFEGYQNYELVDCIVTDTELARKALNQIESAGE